MVQLHVLSGDRAGATFCGHYFPIRVGRADGSDLTLRDPGVWPQHFQIVWEREGLILVPDAEALVSINGTAVRKSLLRNGDIITVGPSKIRFSLSAARQYSSAVTECFTWLGVGILCAFQIALVYILLRF